MPSSTRRVRDQVRHAIAPVATFSEVFGAADLVLRPSVGAQGGAWSIFDPATLLDTRCQLLGDFGEGQVTMANDPARERRLFELEWLDEDPNTFADLHRTGRTAAALRLDVSDPMVVGRFRELLAPMGASDELRMLLRHRGETWGAVCLYRFDGTCFDRAAVEIGEACAPVLAEAVRRVTVELACNSDGVELPPGSLVLGPDDALLVTSQAAEALLGSLDEEQLAPALRSLGASARANDTATLLVTGPGGAVVFHGSRSKGIDDAIGVVVERPRPAAIAPLIMARYGLTEAECRVAELALQGFSRASTARRLEITEHTVGDHLKHIHAKFGVATRAELCARLFDRFYEPPRRRGAIPGPYGYFLDPDG